MEQPVNEAANKASIFPGEQNDLVLLRSVQEFQTRNIRNLHPALQQMLPVIYDNMLVMLKRIESGYAPNLSQTTNKIRGLWYMRTDNGGYRILAPKIQMALEDYFIGRTRTLLNKQSSRAVKPKAMDKAHAQIIRDLIV